MKKHFKILLLSGTVIVTTVATLWSFKVTNYGNVIHSDAQSSTHNEGYSQVTQSSTNFEKTSRQTNTVVSTESENVAADPCPESEDPQKFRANGIDTSGFDVNHTAVSYINNYEY